MLSHWQEWGNRSYGHRLLAAFIGILLFRYPLVFFLFDSGYIKDVQPWTDHFALLCKWDCGIYASLAEHLQPSAFFPLYPALVGWSHSLFQHASFVGLNVGWSALLTVLFGFVALGLGERLFGVGANRSRYFGWSPGAWLFLLFVSVFPDSHFWIRGYSEPLFTILFAGALWASDREDWNLAGLLVGLAAVTRPPGLWLAAIFIFLSLFRRNHRLSSILLCLLPIAGFFYWEWSVSGNAFYSFEAQKGWGRVFNFWAGLKCYLPRWDQNCFCLYLSCWAGFRFLRRPTFSWKLLGLFTLALSNLPLWVGGFYSYNRFMSTNIGLFALLSELFLCVSPWACMAFVIWCVSRLAMQSYHYGAGLWTG